VVLQQRWVEFVVMYVTAGHPSPLRSGFTATLGVMPATIVKFSREKHHIVLIVVLFTSSIM
jgi:hypothetical protein